jgi:hypothetical protein
MLPHVPDVGALLSIGVGAPPNMRPGAILRSLCSLLDGADCDFFIVLDWGKRNDHEHIHGIVYTCDHAAVFRRRTFEPWLRRHRIDSSAVKIKMLFGWNPYVTTGATTRLERDLANLSWYSTREPDGDHVRLLASQSRARGIFVNARKRLVQSNPKPTRVRACEECGSSLPSGVSVRRDFCGGTCRQRANRRTKRIVWKLRLRRG